MIIASGVVTLIVVGSVVLRELNMNFLGYGDPSHFCLLAVYAGAAYRIMKEAILLQISLSS